jgi:Ribosomal RNA adenine dimethylase
MQQLSQNFLRDPKLVDRLIQQAGLGKADTVIDIGAGDGVLRQALAKHCARVIDLEKDHMLSTQLCNIFNEVSNVEVVCDDFLEWPLLGFTYKVFANIPYIATAAIVTKLTTAPNLLLDAHLTVQIEAAQKFAGVPKESLYALLLKPSFRVNITHRFCARPACGFGDAANFKGGSDPCLRSRHMPCIKTLSLTVSQMLAYRYTTPSQSSWGGPRCRQSLRCLAFRMVRHRPRWILKCGWLYLASLLNTRQHTRAAG